MKKLSKEEAEASARRRLNTLLERKKGWLEVREKAKSLRWGLNRLSFETSISYRELFAIAYGYKELTNDIYESLMDAMNRGEKGLCRPMPWGNTVDSYLPHHTLCPGDQLHGFGKKATVVEVLKNGIKVRVAGQYGTYETIWSNDPSFGWECVGALWKQPEAKQEEKKAAAPAKAEKKPSPKKKTTATKAKTPKLRKRKNYDPKNAPQLRSNRSQQDSAHQV